MTCDLALDDTPLPDMEEVYRLAAARVTDAVQRGKVELALRWGRILNLALRDRQMRARLPVTADGVNQRLDSARETPAGPASRRHTNYTLHTRFSHRSRRSPRLARTRPVRASASAGDDDESGF